MNFLITILKIKKIPNLSWSSNDPFNFRPKLKTFIDNYPDLMNIEDNLPAPGIEWEIKVDRKQASKFGVNINSIGNVIKLATNGLKLGEYRPEDSNDSIPMYLRYPNEGRSYR